MRKPEKHKIKKIKQWLHRRMSLVMAILIFLQVGYPTGAMALTGGPSQPEVQSFEPLGTTDMVDLFSGDFNYNLPLLDVEGYPINIGYHSGISTDQEASWVGLGWNINPGVINRNMRGLPDDFAGETVKKELNMKPNKTWGVATNLSAEVFGNDQIKVGLGGSFGFNFNNYSGPSVVKSFNVNISAGLGAASKLNGGLGITSSSDEGLTIQPTIGFSKKIDNQDNLETNVGVKVGTAINSRGGMKQLTISVSAAPVIRGDYVEEEGDYASASMGSQGTSASFDFGQPTYTPKIDMPMKNFSMSGAFTLGGVAWGIHGKVGLSGFYSAQELDQKTIESPAYGYLYAERGQYKDDALMDFNREKDGTFTENTPSLPLTNLTFDTYAVSGQGIGGSYRPFRGEVGHVFDASSYTTNDNDALTAEVGIGGILHTGTNITIIDVLSKSGKWKSDNDALTKLRFTKKGDGTDFENVYFKEANEKTVDADPSFYQAVGMDKAVRFDVDLGKFDHRLKTGFVDASGTKTSFSSSVKRQQRDKKTQNISFLKSSEYADFAIDDSYLPQMSGSAQPHHMAEVTTLGTDGSRYVYGLAAYNTQQKEITFSVGSTDLLSHNNNGSLNDCATDGIVSYSGNDNTLQNAKGIDNYYSSVETPAYAHSFLLTSVLTPDYIDADAVRGPSDGDFGGYTKFKYQKLSDYKWRTPIQSQKATYTEGLKSDYTDDKGNIIYGKKDLYYLDSVITKNYVAAFHKSYRQDGLGVNGENGGANTSDKVMRLDSISLYSKRDRSVPVKRVHFEYTYDLCKGIPNTSVSNTGKLTLTKIYFTYRNSNKAKLSPYTFDYHESTPAGENPNYNLKSYDRWGCYKPNYATTIGVADDATTPGNAASFMNTSQMPPSDYPYVEQNRDSADRYTAVWTLKQINLPSGGTIKMTYESDDYAYVQNREATQMFKIINYVTDTSASALTSANVFQSDTVDFSVGSGFFIFRAADGVPRVEDYVNGIDYVYFRFLENIRATARLNLEYVSGYGEYQSLGFVKRAGVYYGCLSLKNVNLKDNGGGTDVNPVVKAGINFGRIHLPKIVWDATTGNFNGTLSGPILSALVNSSFIKNIRDAVSGPSESLYQYYSVAQSFVGNKSWVRLKSPAGHKLGGGLRVKKIEMLDNWEDMVGSGNGETSNYGQEYSYDLEDGRSSGVASYEPQLGGDENTFRQPQFVNTKKLLVPDDESYVEEPFGESFFPSPSVGYSRVTVRNLQRANVNRHATGQSVSEFYTAKDFPTRTVRTSVESRRGKDGPGSLRSLLKINVRDYFAATQGFVIELNDMHGKPKSQSVYQEGQTKPISSVEYKYKCQPYLNGSFRLTSECSTIAKDGNTGANNIGMFFDMVGDFRESKTETDSKTAEINVDVIPVLLAPFVVPSAWPGFAKDKSRFRSATLTKVIQRFGILEETIAQDLGSVVSTKNLAYDAETGDLLLTQTTTNYNDKMYTFKYPAWWYYDLMGPSYQNLGFEQSNVATVAGAAYLSSANLFREGDEVALDGQVAGNNPLAWVSGVSGNTVNFILKNGASIPDDTYKLKIIRSGRKNTLTTYMATMTSLSDPLVSLKSNAYQDVLQSSATEFSNRRRTHCDCINSNTSIPYTFNPFVNGTRGFWRTLKAYTYLTTRSQTNNNNNTNVRKDGVFEAYTPFYKWNGGSWQTDPDNWTYTSEVTEFNAFGQEVENKDALNRHSSASFGYNQTMPVSVAANAKFSEQGFDGFEDYRFNPCVDDHFKLAAGDTTRAEAHTGRFSIKVSSGTPVQYTKQLAACEVTPECNLELSPVYTALTHEYGITASGTAPYAFSYTILSGATNNPECEVTGAVFQSAASGPYRIKVTVVDAKGCSKSITLNAL
ncbi:MAG: hypothetical protein V4635_13445 [Bacteroidota bacterium]